MAAQVAAAHASRITHIVVRCELATKPMEFGGTKEMFYRIWWTLHMNDAEPESFYIVNSFSMPTDSVAPPPT